MPKQYNAAEWRAYRERRRLAGNPIPNKPAHAQRAYRRERTKSGHPVASKDLKTRRFIAWDGEGITDGAQRGDRPAPHRYVMMANSEGDHLRAHSIGTQEAFDWLIDTAANYPGATHVIYGGGYDATMILKSLSDMPKNANLTKRKEDDGKAVIAYIMYTTQPGGVRVELGGRLYSIEYRQRKFLTIRRFRNARRPGAYANGKWHPDYDGSITLWDVIGFYQSTFVTALEKNGIAVDTSAIDAMKKRRGSFKKNDEEAMLAYCKSECVALQLLIGKLHEAALTAGIHPSRWDGAGAGAAALMKREGVKAHRHPEPVDLADPVARAFFGGRIELLGVGRTGTLYGYDVSSAYPWGATTLPDLHGRWARSANALDGALSLVHCRFAFRDGLPWYPLPHRNERHEIRFAAAGEGWYWREEFLAALVFAEARGGTVTLLDSWSFMPDTDALPFGFIQPLYEQRQIWKREGNGAEKFVKLCTNSIYGKSAQQVGARNGRLPPFFSLTWAGNITARTRARLVHTGLASPDTIVAFATDGLYSTVPLDVQVIPIGEHLADDVYPALGDLEGPTVYADGVFVQAGVYWLLRHGDWEAKYRGFNREGFERPDLALDAWLSAHRMVMVPVTRFVTYGSALPGKDLWKRRATWFTVDRKLDLSGASAKRYAVHDDARPHEEFVRTAPRTNLEGSCSVPFESISLLDEYQHDSAADVSVTELYEIADNDI